MNTQNPIKCNDSVSDTWMGKDRCLCFPQVRGLKKEGGLIIVKQLVSESKLRKPP